MSNLRRLRPTSYDPDEDDRQQDLDRCERGAIGIFGEVTGACDFEKARWKWETHARPLTKERHRREARACLRAAI